jgi:transposase
MLSLPPSVQIWLSVQPADLRKSFDGLAALVEHGLGGDPLSGHVFVFRNKAADRIKLLVWDEDGYVIYYKRLEAGTFRFPASGAQVHVTIRAADLLMLLDGVDLASVRRRPRYRRPRPA